ncbi:MAG: hypothetical protein RR608_06780 [Bacteroidales bacterium]
MKSSIIQYEMITDGNSIPMTQYSDDYGNLLCMKMYMMGVEIATITNKDTVYVLNYPQKSGVKYVRPESDINYNDLTPEVIKKFNIKATGTVEFLNKKCTVYTAEFENEGLKVETTAWIYKGLLLKSVATYGDAKKVELVATSIEENPEVSPETFTVPEGFNIRNM